MTCLMEKTIAHPEFPDEEFITQIHVCGVSVPHEVHECRKPDCAFTWTEDKGR